MTDVALSQAGLRRIIGRQPEAHALVSAFVDALDAQVSIEDVDGRLLHGTILPSSGERFAVRHGEASLGFVVPLAETGSQTSTFIKERGV